MKARLPNSGITALLVLFGALAPIHLEAQQAHVTPALRAAVNASGGRVIVTMQRPGMGSRLMMSGEPPVTPTELAQIEQRLETGNMIRPVKRLNLSGALVARVTDAQLTSLAADASVSLIEPDVWVRLQEVSDLTPATSAAQTTPWGITRVGSQEAWALVGRGSGVKVGIMDSGGDTNHPDISWAGGYNAITGSTAQSAWEDNVSSCNGHGTHVAGTVAARDNTEGVVGVAPDVSMYAIKVFQEIDGACGAWISDQIAALNWAVANGIRVVNSSLGGATGVQAYNFAINNAADAGTFMVAAAGNTGGAMMYPAAYTGAIAVAALTSSDVRASFSSTGPNMGFAAPGNSVLSTLPGGGYGNKSGTSMAAPHVTGVVALILAQNPGLDLEGVRTKLKDGALDVGGAGWEQQTGWGLVRANYSLGGGTVLPTMMVSPSSRRATVAQGAVAPNDSASISIAGVGGAILPWAATNRKSWNTLTTALGVGGGRVRWSRDAAGLEPGTYVDTITVTAIALGSPDRVIDTLIVTAPPATLALNVSPASRRVSVQAGSAAPSETATVTLTGTGAATKAWTATKRKSWTTLTTASGTGSGTVRWNRNSSGLAAGTYIDTITVTATGATGSPDRVIDTLVVTAAAVPLALNVSPASRNTSVQQGTAAPAETATVTLTGDGAGTTAWTATKRKSWTTLTTASGTGSGTARWNRNSTGLAPGVYVDTITVTASGATGSPGRVIDTLTITATPVPLALEVSPASRRVSTQVGTAAPNESATVALTGDGASSANWTATKRKAWTTLTTASGTSNGTVVWNRNTTGLAVGTYVDTITVTVAGATGSPDRVIDTLVITAAPVPLALVVSPASRRVSAQQGTAAPNETATVALTGDGASSANWTATKRKAWTTLTTASGTGSGTVAWNRSTNGLAVGTYVDTITVTVAGATGSPDRVIDTLVITAVPVPLALTISPTSRSESVQQGTAAPNETATVTLTGDGAASANWTATKRKAWTTLTTASGSGSGTVRWNRSSTGLVPGVYVDTITVTVAGATGSPTRVIDTLTITAIPVPLAIAVSPTSRRASAQIGTAAPNETATVTLTGDGASTAAWTATKRKAWTTLTTASGTGNGTVGWNRSTSGLSVGTYVDTITVTSPGAAGSPRRVIDTLTITAAPVALALAVSPTSRRVSVVQGSAAPNETAAVALTGDGSATAAWTATKRKAWTTLTTASGTGSGTVRWNRSSTGLVPGVYIDTITVSASGATGSPGRIIDTLTITAPPVALALLVSPPSRRVSVVEGGTAPAETGTVTLTGDGAAAATWTASKRKAWTTLTTASGTGSGTVSWSRNINGMSPGTYIDTISVAVAGALGSPDRIIDTLTITAAPVALAIAVSPGSRQASAQQGTAAPSDSGTVTLSGDGAAATNWSAAKRKSWTTLSTASGTGSGKVRWTRSTAGLNPGVYVDTITVTAAGALGSPDRIIDTLTVSAAPVALALELSPGSRRVTVTAGETALQHDSVEVRISGTGSATAAWSATKRKGWTTITTATGSGSGALRWFRQPSGLAAGTYVDTITVTVAGVAPRSIIDTLTVVPATSEVQLAVSAISQLVEVLQGSLNSTAQVGVTLTGSGAASMPWTASKRRQWTNLTTASGVGTGTVRWTRNMAGLLPGTYVDTITVTAGTQSRTIIDSMMISRPARILLAKSGALQRQVRMAGESTALQEATVQVQGVEGITVPTTNWTATKKSAWLNLVTASGDTPGQLRWGYNAASLPAGRYIDTLVVALNVDNTVRGTYIDTLDVVVVSSPEPELAAAQLLQGGNRLSSDQRALLDGVGNRNGSYDLGDFLAWVDRNGINLSASLMQELQTSETARRARRP